MNQEIAPARTTLSRIAYVSAGVGAFIICAALIRAQLNSMIDTRYQRAITALTEIEDVDSSVKDMLIASKGLLISPDNKDEWQDSRNAGLRFRRSLALALRHSYEATLSGELRFIEADYGDILRTSGRAFRQQLEKHSPDRFTFYYESHFPRIRALLQRIRAAHDLAFENAAEWYRYKEGLGYRIEGGTLIVLSLSLGLLIHWTRTVSARLARAFEGASQEVIGSAIAIGRICHKMSTSSRVLHDASLAHEKLVEAALGKMERIATLLSSLQKLKLLQPWTSEGIAGGLDSAQKQLREIIQDVRNELEQGHQVLGSCQDSFEILNIALQVIYDGVRSQECGEEEGTIIQEGLGADTTQSLTDETRRLLESVVRLSVISSGTPKPRSKDENSRNRYSERESARPRKSRGRAAF